MDMVFRVWGIQFLPGFEKAEYWVDYCINAQDMKFCSVDVDIRCTDVNIDYMMFYWFRVSGSKSETFIAQMESMNDPNLPVSIMHDIYILRPEYNKYVWGCRPQRLWSKSWYYYSNSNPWISKLRSNRSVISVKRHLFFLWFTPLFTLEFYWSDWPHSKSLFTQQVTLSVRVHPWDGKGNSTGTHDFWKTRATFSSIHFISIVKVMGLPGFCVRNCSGNLPLKTISELDWQKEAGHLLPAEFLLQCVYPEWSSGITIYYRQHSFDTFNHVQVRNDVIDLTAEDDFSWHFVFLSALTYNSVIEQMDYSLNNLQRKSIELFYLNAPDHNTPIEETLRAVDKLHKGKLVCLVTIM